MGSTSASTLLHARCLLAGSSGRLRPRASAAKLTGPMRIALATCLELPEPDPDMAPLAEALLAEGLEPWVVAWDDPSADLASSPLCLIRSTWDYHHRRDEFVAWARRAASVTSLWNGPEVLAWNTHKGYLRDLERAGVAVTPTDWVARGERASLGEIMRRRGWPDVVVKPAVSAGSFATDRFDERSLERGELHLARVLESRDAMIQPYLTSVEERGERSLVFLAGELSHVMRKSPRLGDAPENVTGPVEADEAELALARRALACAPAPLLYARVDLTQGPDGAPVVMELELVEPSLFLRASPAGLARFARALADRCRMESAR